MLVGIRDYKQGEMRMVYSHAFLSSDSQLLVKRITYFCANSKYAMSGMNATPAIVQVKP